MPCVWRGGPDHGGDGSPPSPSLASSVPVPEAKGAFASTFAAPKAKGAFASALIAAQVLQRHQRGPLHL
jgi:hypothetical protein